MKHLFYITVVFFLSQSVAFAQMTDESFNDIKITNIGIGYGIEFPFGNMADKFGSNLKFTLGADRITKSNYVYGVDFSLMFGSNTKQDPISNLRLSNNEILGADNEYADVFIRERGMYLGAHFGKIFKLSESTRSGIRTTIGLGVFQHKYRIIDEARSLPQIENDYLKGYDHLNRGLAIREFIGYQHISKDKRINFIIGLEFTQAFTKNVRAVDFNTGNQLSKDLNFDGLIGIKGAFFLPFFDDYTDEEIFY
mgnify:CR=1 FL=1